MAYVVARRDGRFEIRESAHTPRGPRARTLAVFRELSAAVLDRAQERAAAVIDRDALAARARALGAPDAGDAAAVLARRLAAEMRRGGRVPRALATVIARDLAGPRVAVPDSVEPALDWLDASPERRGRALRDLLRVASRVPPRPRPAVLAFPPLGRPRRAAA
ncbi:MAG: hypothetical protein AB1416_13410 [Actinomycetota bacterium]